MGLNPNLSKLNPDETTTAKRKTQERRLRALEKPGRLVRTFKLPAPRTGAYSRDSQQTATS